MGISNKKAATLYTRAPGWSPTRPARVIPAKRLAVMFHSWRSKSSGIRHMTISKEATRVRRGKNKSRRAGRRERRECRSSLASEGEKPLVAYTKAFSFRHLSVPFVVSSSLLFWLALSSSRAPTPRIPEIVPSSISHTQCPRPLMNVH